jgi:hypothetical protein
MKYLIHNWAVKCPGFMIKVVGTTPDDGLYFQVIVGMKIQIPTQGMIATINLPIRQERDWGGLMLWGAWRMRPC